MESDEEIDAIQRRLQDPDWLVRCGAIRGNWKMGKRAVPLLPAIFDLGFDDYAPPRSDSSLEIKRFGVLAVPFLLREARSEFPARRVQALFLLTETGERRSSSTRLVEQILEPRCAALPDWGDYRDEVLSMFHTSLAASARSVRYAAAAALEEFGLFITETIPVFIDVLRYGSTHERNWAALHLGRIGPPAKAAADVLAEAARVPAGFARHEVVYGLKYVRLAAQNALQSVTAGPLRQD